MGGRGSSSPAGGDKRNGYGKKEDPMNVPFDEWGAETDERIYGEWNGERTQIGYYEDRTVYDYEEDIRPVTKKEALAEIDVWRNDEYGREQYGSYGDEDVSIIVAYKDGKVISDDELENGKAFKKAGIVGVSISTPDYQMVWGGEVGRDGKLLTWETSENEEGKTYTNSYAGYKPVSLYKVRYKIIHNNQRPNGTYYTTYERVRQSTKKKVNW